MLKFDRDGLVIIHSVKEQKQFFSCLQKLFLIIRRNLSLHRISIPALPKSFEEERNELLQIFAQPNIKNICTKCRGKCCNSYPNFPPMDFQDIFYIFAKNKKFKLPDPDWSFLYNGRNNKTKKRKLSFLSLVCPLLGPKGCLFQEHRPLVCLCHTCEKIEKIIKTRPNLYNIHSELNPWYESLRRLNIQRSGRRKTILTETFDKFECGHSVKRIIPMLLKKRR